MICVKAGRGPSSSGVLGTRRYNTMLKACAKAGNADAAAAVFARMRERGVRLNAKTSAAGPNRAPN